MCLILSNMISLDNLNNNTLSYISGVALYRKDFNILSVRLINNYSLFSSFISKFLTNLKASSLVGFVELDLVDWDFVLGS